MSCILHPSPIFGPVRSRRLGVSLGVNLLPAQSKFCSFDCIYCECGFNKDHCQKEPLPSREKVLEALERKLKMMAEKGEPLDVITFAGNGEPTSHPQFPQIIEDTIKLRDRYFPKTGISVLSNSTFLKRPEVVKALKKVENNILKLDTVDPIYIEKVDRPNSRFNVRDVIEKMKEFDGHVIVQTLFMTGEDDSGWSVDNTSDRYVKTWLEALKEIKPEKVMIYTIARETPEKGLKKASPAVLDEIARKVEKIGIPVQVSY